MDDKTLNTFRQAGLGLFASYMQPCPAGCGRDRFDHDIMKNPCEGYAKFLAEKENENSNRSTNG